MFIRSVEGNYYPSFFIIHIMSNEENEDIIHYNRSTFVHEYIHFLQDVILPYCIRNNMSYFCWFKDICDYSLNRKQIERPFNNWSKNSSDLNMQYEQTFGSTKDIFKELTIQKIEPSKESFSGFDQRYSMKERNLDVYKYCIIFNNKLHYQIGARDILEYIAHKIEVKQYGINDHFPRYPYSTIDMLFEYYGFSDINDVKKILIAEYCMYNDNPIHFLHTIFLNNKKLMQKVCKIDDENLYYLLLNTAIVSKDGVQEDLRHKVERRSKDFMSTLTALYNHSQLLCDWVEKVNSYSRGNFLDRFLFTDLYRMNKNNFDFYINRLNRELGIPLLLNKNEKIIHIGEKSANEFEYLYIIESFINYIIKKDNKKSNKSCPVAKFCESNYNIKCDKKYDSQKTVDEKCPYKRFLNMNQLQDISIQE